jgi:hypothetical protein
MLLGVRVTAYAIINIAEHQRRETAGMGAVIEGYSAGRVEMKCDDG